MANKIRTIIRALPASGSEKLRISEPLSLSLKTIPSMKNCCMIHFMKLKVIFFQIAMIDLILCIVNINWFVWDKHLGECFSLSRLVQVRE